MATPEESRRAFETMRMVARKRRLKELWIGILLGIVCSLLIALIIFLLNLRPSF